MKSNKILYINNIEKYNAEKKKLKQISFFYTLARLISFVAVISFVVFYVKHELEPIWLIGIGVSAIVLAVAVRLDALHFQHSRMVDQLLLINKVELDYLEQKFDSLDAGVEFIDIKNPFTSDLDVFGLHSIFQAINRSATAVGRSKLASWLSCSLLDRNQIIARQGAVEELKNAVYFRQRFQAIGQLDKDSLCELSQIDSWTKEQIIIKNKKVLIPALYILPIVSIGSILCAIFIPSVSSEIPVGISVFMHCIKSSYRKYLNDVHRKLGLLYLSFSKYARLLDLVEKQEFRSCKMIGLYEIFQGEGCRAAEAMMSLSRLLNSFDQRKNFVVDIVFNSLYLRDLQLLVKLDKWKTKHDAYIHAWINAASEIDVLCSISNFSFNHPEYIFPEICESILIEAKGIGHPLIPSTTRVDNDFSIDQLGQFNIVTGANMAGKSTFLRSVGVNLLLASCGAPVCASTFRFKPMVLFTSMRTTDNLAKHTSYFHAELLRLKSLMNAAENGHELFVILDEILKGTNSTDKLIGSRKFLTKLKDLPIAGLVATHDLALGELSVEFPSHFKNICFEVEIADRNIKFDYKLREGISQNMNATVLMEQMGIV